MGKHFALLLLPLIGLTLFAVPGIAADIPLPWDGGGGGGGGDCDLCPGGKICIPNPLKACTFEKLVGAIIGFIYRLALVVAPIMIVISGFFFVISGGDPNKIRTAKDILLYTVIGLFIIMISWGLIQIIKDIFGVVE